MAPEPEPLSERDTSLLRFEARWPKHTVKKEEAIRAVFGITAARYYQRLYALIVKPSAILFDPLLVHRVERTRDERSAQRADRVFGRPNR